MNLDESLNVMALGASLSSWPIIVNRHDQLRLVTLGNVDLLSVDVKETFEGLRRLLK